jgi:ABC-2 type transport system ATP-binding protein
MTDTAPMIELRNLHRYFGRTRAVDDVSFKVHKGQVFGYIGPNGAGKTTSMRVLATLDVPSAGDAFVDGFSVVNDPDRVRCRLGFMPDYFGTYPNVNVREYLDFFARAYQIDRRKRPDAIDRVMAFTGLDVLAEKPTSGLSKGMKQRLCLGRTMIHDPPVMVLDEPAAGLDPRARIELREMIRALAAAGKAILISSHILTELAEICDTVGIIERGRLLAVGSVEEIQRQCRAPHNVVHVRLLDDAAGLGDWLAGEAGKRGLAPSPDVTPHPGEARAATVPVPFSQTITEVRVAGNAISFLHAGNLEGEAALLRAMIEAGFRVVAFGSQRQTLEDVFMQVTRGLVQ